MSLATFWLIAPFAYSSLLTVEQLNERALEVAGTRLDPNGRGLLIELDGTYLAASIALSAGDLVNIFNDGGTAKIRLADSSDNRLAHGFIEDDVLQDAEVRVQTTGLIDGLSGLTPGTEYFLGEDGAPTATVPTATGSLRLPIGVAVSSTQLQFNIGVPIVNS